MKQKGLNMDKLITRFLDLQGQDAAQLDQRQVDWLRGQGYSGSKLLMWKQHLLASGYTGNFQQSFKEFLESDGLLGPEKLVSTSITREQDFENWSTTETSQELIKKGEVLLTSLNDFNDRTVLTLTDMEVGETYRATARVKAGTGTNQAIIWRNWCAFTQVGSLSSDWTTYSNDLECTATSGDLRLQPSFTGSTGDQLFWSDVSVRKVL